MTKKLLDAHPSVLVAYSPEAKKFLMGVYDQTYPKIAYRGSANNLGGNPEESDSSPEQVLLKEIFEEFNPAHLNEKKHLGKVEWALDSDIRLVRNSLLGNIEPYQDFLVIAGEIPGGQKPYTAIYSAFYNEISGRAIEIAEKNIRENRHLTTEGVVGVFTLEDLCSSDKKEFSTAHAAAPIINYKFNGANIPYPSALTAEPIGQTKKFFKDYLTDFEYNSEKLKKAARAQD